MPKSSLIFVLVLFSCTEKHFECKYGFYLRGEDNDLAINCLEVPSGYQERNYEVFEGYEIGAAVNPDVSVGELNGALKSVHGCIREISNNKNDVLLFLEDQGSIASVDKAKSILKRKAITSFFDYESASMSSQTQIQAKHEAFALEIYDFNKKVQLCLGKPSKAGYLRALSIENNSRTGFSAKIHHQDILSQEQLSCLSSLIDRRPTTFNSLEYIIDFPLKTAPNDAL